MLPMSCQRVKEGVLLCSYGRSHIPVPITGRVEMFMLSSQLPNAAAYSSACWEPGASVTTKTERCRLPTCGTVRTNLYRTTQTNK